MKVKKDNPGFTFVELLLVTAMLAVIGLAVYSTFSSGINFWLRITQQKPEEDIIIFFEKISYDLRNSFRYTGIDFEGSSDKISFPTIGEFQTKGGREEGIGRLEYIFDRNSDSLKVRQSNYSEAYQNKVSDERELVSNVESLNFKYYYYDPAQKKYYWESSWQTGDGASFGVVTEKQIPLAVRIEVEVENEQLHRKFQRTVFIPAAYYLSFAER